MSEAENARAEAVRLLEQSMVASEDDGYASRCIARAQVYATLAISLELASTLIVSGP